jgi:hypothetical protein
VAREHPGVEFGLAVGLELVEVVAKLLARQADREIAIGNG